VWKQVESLLEQGVDQNLFSGCALVVRSGTEEYLRTAHGFAEREPRLREANNATVWDLASLTKVLVTTPLVMCMVEQGRLDLDAPLSKWIPNAPSGVTAAHCLAHSTGLPAWKPLFATVIEEQLRWGARATRERMLELALAHRTLAAPGQAYAYSDLGILLLGAALERMNGERLDRLWEEMVQPRANVDLRWGWEGAAATEMCPVRGEMVIGNVHDLNAAVMGGIAPHAGLFGSAVEVAKMAAWQMRAHQARESSLSSSTVQRFFGANGPGSHHLGWDGVSPGGSAGPFWPKDGVGHLAFTGCSVWMAPAEDVLVVFLSNRIHPYVGDGPALGPATPEDPLAPRTVGFREFRPRLHTSIVEALRAGGKWRPGPGA